MTPKIQSGKLFSGSSIGLAVASFMMFSIVVDIAPLAIGQTPAASPNEFQATAPVMTFLDMYTGQPWGRYVVSETVTVPKYEYKEVKDKVWVPTWVQEPKQTTMTQYDPIVSYQLRPRSVPSANPFAPPQQIVEYVPIVQYQPRNVQTTQMTAYQKYEEREVSRMVPVLVNASEQRQRFVDRPLSAGAAPGVAASNLIQDSAMLAQANRTTARYPTRSIDYPAQPTYGSPVYGYTASNATWNAPATLPPPPAVTPPQYTARQAASAPIVPIVAQSSAPAYPPVYAGTGTPIPPPSGPPTMPYGIPVPGANYANPAGTYAATGYPAPGYPATGYPQPGYPFYPAPQYPPQQNPASAYPPPGYGYPAGAYAANPYAAWYMRQGTLFSSPMFSTTGGQSSMASGGYPYKGYPAGAVPPPAYGVPGGYSAPRVASNPLGVSTNAPNYLGRTSLPFSSGGF